MAEQAIEVVSAGLNGRFRYCTLVADFDAGDLVPSPRAWLAASEFLAHLKLQETDAPAVVVDADGSVQLEWHRDGADAEVRVESDGTMSLWCAGPFLLSLVSSAVNRRMR